MLYALGVLTRWFCPPKRQPPHTITELNETKPESTPEPSPAPSPEPEPSTPKPTGTAEAVRIERSVNPPSSPVIAPIATATYPDLPTLNPSLVRDDTYTV